MFITSVLSLFVDFYEQRDKPSQIARGIGCFTLFQRASLQSANCGC